MTGAILVCLIMFVTATLLSSGAERTSYLAGNLVPIIIGGVGLFVTNVGFYLMFSRVGANNYMAYASLSILTTAAGVGMIIFCEPFNQYHIFSVLFAILAVSFYEYGQIKLKG